MFIKHQLRIFFVQSDGSHRRMFRQHKTLAVMVQHVPDQLFAKHGAVDHALGIGNQADV